MTSLCDILSDPSKRPQVINDCVQLIDSEVADKGGMAGFAIKAGYQVIKGIKPGFIPEVVDALLNEFGKALENVYQEGKAKGNVETHFVQNAGQVADALLAITDARAAKAKSAAAKKAYDSLRGTAKKNVEAAVPRLGKLIQKYAG